MPIPLGILAAAGFRPPAAGGSYDLLESIVLTGPQTSVSFANVSSYASTYKHLQIRTTIFSGQANLIGMTLNGDNGVRTHVLRGRAGAVTSFDNGGATYVMYCGDSSVASTSVVDLLDPFVSGKNKVARTMTGLVLSTPEVALTSALWAVTAPLSSITIPHPNGFNFLTGSRFALYGIKGS